VWVASKIPAGYVTGTANQARHRTFNQSDPDNVLFSPDVISFARSIGAWNGTDADFDFQAAYDPITFSGV
jgi:dipeptidase